MKATYSGFEAKKSGNYLSLPKPGAYIGEIQGAREEDAYIKDHKALVLMLEVTEGEYKNRYHDVYAEQSERFGKDSTKYKGVLKITAPNNDDSDDLLWIRTIFENAMCCVQESNDGYTWDWDEQKLVGKGIGFSVRESIYTGNDGSERHTTEICQLESVPDVKGGKVKPIRARDSRRKKPTSDNNMTDVTGKVDVPF